MSKCSDKGEQCNLIEPIWEVMDWGFVEERDEGIFVVEKGKICEMREEAVVGVVADGNACTGCWWR